MQNTNTTTREKAMYYWNQQISEFGQMTLTSIHYPERSPLSLTGSEIEKIYLTEHPSETTPTSNGVIEGLEDAANKYCNEERAKRPELNLEFNIWMSGGTICGFREGAQWHKETHYNPLLELCRELFSSYMMNQYREANIWGINDERRDEIFKENPIIQQANKLLLNK